MLVPSDADPGLLRLENVRREESVDQGDTVITAATHAQGLTPLLPRGIPIGKVTSVSQTDWATRPR